MDVGRFTGSVPGELVAIEGDHAFVPDPLPPRWSFPVGLWPLLAEARERVGMLEGLGRTLPNPAIMLRPLEDREAIQSSRLEGTYVAARELLLFEVEPSESGAERDRASDWREVFNYRKALHAGASTELPLSLRLVRQLHEILLSGVRGRDRAPGEFRRVPVAIGSTRRFVPPPASRLMECLGPLEKYLHTPDPNCDPLVDCFLVHYQFEAIHPFMDGNGRVGRVLLAIMLQQRCRLSKPWLYLSEYFEKNREDYIQRLFEVSTRSNWTAWVEFCLHATIAQAKNAIERCERLLVIKEEYAKRITDSGGPVRLNQIVEDIFHSPFVRVADLARQLGVTYPTAQADVDRLVAAGILKRLPNATPKTFFAPEVFHVAYEDVDEGIE